ncbi:MAG: prolipoprotein diacylglyceryl transferase [Ardenticatenaceae bacterium]|nr:prolipoprotein diacylglyceryl transferase [Ardenticatenaceae bacterium]
MSRYLDNFLRPSFHHQPTWRLCVFGGMVVGMGLAIGLATAVGLSPWVAGGAALVGVLACGLIGLGKLALTGVENYTFYHYQMGVLAVTAVFLLFTHHPLLPYLDVIALALAAALACGRWGCQAAGCCHGRPHRWGVCYGERPYRALGFTPHLLGVRLFPVQLAESLWLWLIVLSGGWMALGGAAPGMVLAWYVVGYGSGRFCLEFWRGDGERPYRGPFSTAQWTCLAWLGAAAVAELSGLLPAAGWQLAVIGVCGAGAVRQLLPRPRARQAFNRAAHIEEIIQALAQLEGKAARPVQVRRTSLGYRLSVEIGPDMALYTLSHEQSTLAQATAVQFAHLILCLHYPNGQARILPGPPNVYHVIVQTGAERPSLAHLLPAQT